MWGNLGRSKVGDSGSSYSCLGLRGAVSRGLDECTAFLPTPPAAHGRTTALLLKISRSLQLWVSSEMRNEHGATSWRNTDRNLKSDKLNNVLLQRESWGRKSIARIGKWTPRGTLLPPIFWNIASYFPWWHLSQK